MEVCNNEKYVNVLRDLSFTPFEQEKIINQMGKNKYLKWILDDEYYYVNKERLLIALRMLLKFKSGRKRQLLFLALKHVPFANADMSIFNYGLNALMRVNVNGEENILKAITNSKYIFSTLKDDNPKYRLDQFTQLIHNIMMDAIDTDVKQTIKLHYLIKRKNQ
jgi:hypothetical protein